MSADSFHFSRKETAAAGVKRIVSEQLELAIAEIDDGTIERHQAVHQVRKRCKKIRALLRLVRSELGESYPLENAWFRDSAKHLSALRDAQALVESCDALRATLPPDQSSSALSGLAERLRRDRDKTTSEAAVIEARLRDFQDRMRQARKRVAEWPLEKQTFALLKEGLLKTYLQARKDLRAAYRDPRMESFHEWRKQTKYHWYHTRLLRHVWPEIMLPRAQELKKLSSLLGDEHDLALLRQLITARPGDFGPEAAIKTCCEQIMNRQAQLRQAAKPLGSRIFAEKPKQHIYRLKHLWWVWQTLDG